MRFRKKPVIIEAIQYNGNNFDEIKDFMSSGPRELSIHPVHGSPVINTLEGDHIVTIGDYVIKGVKGEFYPCKPDIFKMTYEGVDAS